MELERIELPLEPMMNLLQQRDLKPEEAQSILKTIELKDSAELNLNKLLEALDKALED